mgnify:CR=1 FL=1
MAEPKWIPKGTVAEFVAVWDNSANNPSNPDPSQVVDFGVFTRNEMGNANVTYMPVDPTWKALTIENGKEVKTKSSVR